MNTCGAHVGHMWIQCDFFVGDRAHNNSCIILQVVSDAAFSLMKATFMDAFDDNKDEKIDIAEVSYLLIN